MLTFSNQYIIPFAMSLIVDFPLICTGAITLCHNETELLSHDVYVCTLHGSSSYHNVLILTQVVV